MSTSFRLLVPCTLLDVCKCRPTFRQQYLESGKSKHCLYGTFFKEYSISFLMVCRLIDIALVLLKLSMPKVRGIIGISKIKLLNFSCAERVNTDNKFADAEELENSYENICMPEEFVYFYGSLFNFPQTKFLDINSDANLNYKKAKKLKFLYQMVIHTLHNSKQKTPTRHG